MVIILAVKDRQIGSIGTPKGVVEVETVPPGNIPTAPPEYKKFKAEILVWILSLEASLVSSNAIGRITPLNFSELQNTLCAKILKSFRDFDKI